MHKLIYSLACIWISLPLLAQESSAPSATDSAWKNTYRASFPLTNKLVHTRLDIRFDYDRSYAYGKAWLTLKPHFYATDSLQLDAKGMNINQVALFTGNRLSPLPYRYDGKVISIQLDRSYKGGESYTVYIDYTAKPNEYGGKGSAAITDAKGLYFINPLGTEKDKPTQIWTQGETEGTSVWCPTIDKPNQKTTQEFNLTVPDKYVSLSNGKLVAQKKNTDGTRTDTWKMDQPHAPYLFFIGVGDYAVVKDSYKGKEVSYYVEKAYGPVARKIFGHTPEMIAFFSRITGVDYPWVKYAQITGQDYVSGAMENTTSTLHASFAQQDARELVDGNKWESTIAHELFHQWFGDYVTSESWSNLTLNESFANYSEVLWDEYKYGKDAGDAQNYNDQFGYLQSGSEQKDLVRFYYADREDMFDAVSYNKGGRILHMLRNFVGDSAFFKSLNLYLTTHKYQAAEAHHLRLAFEAVTGLDLNWFFNQWYYGSGHPRLSINYAYDDASGRVTVILRQTQEGEKIFRLPITVDIYQGSSKQRYTVWMEHRTDSFHFPYTTHPDLVNVDADKILLAEKQENKSLAQYIHQYQYAGNYLDRREAIEYALKKQSDEKAQDFLLQTLKDPYKGLRNLALSQLNLKQEALKAKAEPLIYQIARQDPDPGVRATAISLLSRYTHPDYKELYQKQVQDSSYSVSGAALAALAEVDDKLAMESLAKMKGQTKKGRLLQATLPLMIRQGDEQSLNEILTTYSNMAISQEKFDLTISVCEMLGKINNSEKLRQGVDAIVAFRDQIPEQFGIGPVINNFLRGIINKKEAAKSIAIDKAPLQEQIDYIKGKIEGKEKGF